MYHYTISELCKGLYRYHNGVEHESNTSSDSPVSTTGASAAAWSVGGKRCAHQHYGDGEVSGSDVSEGVCEAPTFTEWSTMVVPTYPEGGSHALKVCQGTTIRFQSG